MVKVLDVIEKTLLSKCVSAGWFCCLSTVVPVCLKHLHLVNKCLWMPNDEVTASCCDL